MQGVSLRYGGANFDIRHPLIRLCGWLQGKKVHILDSNPRQCAKFLSASDTKGTFIEFAFATPAWKPLYSIESVDGSLWKTLSSDCRFLMNHLDWKTRLPSIMQLNFAHLKNELASGTRTIIDAEVISRFVLRVLFELLFEFPISKSDESLFYQASLEFRKEIGIKGLGNSKVKRHFHKRLTEILVNSKHSDFVDRKSKHFDEWLSVFAQPFLISPQINVSDIMAAIFYFLSKDQDLAQKAQTWANESNYPLLNGIILEAIRLKHPFPVLEREVQTPIEIDGNVIESGTQVFIFLDRFRQDHTFDPHRWTLPPSQNPYHALPFGTGPRVCLGKGLATHLLCELLRVLLNDYNLDFVKPSANHLYSGRDNDKTTSLRETLYQLKTLAGFVWTSFRLGRKKNHPITEMG